MGAILRSLPWRLMGAGIIVKSALIMWLRIAATPSLANFITSRDPLASWLAEGVIARLFDQRRFAPSASESVTFEVLLVAFFGVECFLIGSLIATMWRRYQRAAGAHSN
jgi:hypothetical protein